MPVSPIPTMMRTTTATIATMTRSTTLPTFLTRGPGGAVAETTSPDESSRSWSSASGVVSLPVRASPPSITAPSTKTSPLCGVGCVDGSVTCFVRVNSVHASPSHKRSPSPSEYQPGGGFGASLGCGFAAFLSSFTKHESAAKPKSMLNDKVLACRNFLTGSFL